MEVENNPALRNRAVGMVFAASKQSLKHVGIINIQLHCWLQRAQEHPVSKPGRGQKATLNPVAGRLIAMAVKPTNITNRRES